MRDKLKFANYIITSFLIYFSVVDVGLNFFWTMLIMIVVNLIIIAMVDAIDSQDNMYLFSFLVSLPFVLYWTEESGELASQNFLVFFSTLFLCVALPFVFILLFELWELAGEE